MTTRRKLVVKGRGPDAQVTYYVEAYQGKIWVTTYDYPFISEAIFEPSQADSLVELINQITKEARGYRP
ncbi:MAG: hypothetical protein ACREX3_09555 [Gammaproteobacteria bacterium]